ncbi:MAG: type II secretion system protein [Alphaproteobacteria bacterium]|nr:type II secretion system protein [Alphaproteobacteria bacterium]
MKFKENGRSMVEMLGVLAIIGVLSVGALSGYNNAMKKHKFNQLVTNWEQFIANIKYYEDFLIQESQGKSTYFPIISYLQSLHIVPDTWNVQETTLFDNFQNASTIHISFNTRITIDYYLGSSVDSSFKTTFCTDMLMRLIKPNSNSFEFTFVYRGQDNPSSVRFWGDNFCSGSKKCIKDMTATDAYDICAPCVQGSDCILAIAL